MFEIEKGIPCPVRWARKFKYPFAEMEAGDSFLIPEGMTTLASVQTYPSTASKKMSPKRFTGRQVEGGYRIWRVE